MKTVSYLCGKSKVLPYLGCFLVSFFSLALQAQSNNRISDSLIKHLSTLADDTNKVNEWNRLSTELGYTEPSVSLKFSTNAIKLATNLKWKKGMAKAMNIAGNTNCLVSNHTKAFEYYNQALAINLELNDKFQIAKTYSNMGLAYLEKSAYPKALEFLFLSLKYFEEINFKVGIGNQYGAIGNVYSEQKDYSKAMHYDSMAMTVFQKIGDKEGVAIQLGNIGNAHEALGNFDQAIAFNIQSMNIYQAIQDPSGVARNLMNIGIVYNDRNQCKKALDYLLKAQKIYEELNDVPLLSTCLGNIGQCYLLSVTKENANQHVKPELIEGTKSNLLSKSIEYMHKAYDITSSTGDISLRQFLTKRLSEAYSLNGNFQLANQYLLESNALKDSIFSIESHMAIENITTEREVLLKNKQIEIDRLAVEKKRNERVFFIIGIGLILVIFGFVLRSYIKQKRLTATIEIEKEKSDSLLLNILPAEIANELKEKGSASARHYDNVSVLFTDFKDFTTTSENMTPTELVNEINFIYSEFDRIISHYNIEKIKTIGDSYMCAGGIPEPGKSSPADVVNAALDIRNFVNRTLEEKKRAGQHSFQIRIGIHTGPVVAGIVGIKKFAYDIWGDTVNLASRMESSGEAGMVNISHDTHELVKDQFDCQYRGKIKAKHKGEIDMYYVLGKKAT